MQSIWTWNCTSTRLALTAGKLRNYVPRQGINANSSTTRSGGRKLAGFVPHLKAQIRVQLKLQLVAGFGWFLCRGRIGIRDQLGSNPAAEKLEKLVPCQIRTRAQIQLGNNSDSTIFCTLDFWTRNRKQQGSIRLEETQRKINPR